MTLPRWCYSGRFILWLSTALVLAGVAVIVACMWGCAAHTSIDGATTKVSEEWIEPDPAGSAGHIRRKVVAESTGPTIKTSADEVAQQIDAKAQGVTTPNASANGGGFSSRSSGKILEKSKGAALFWCGILAVLAGGGLLYGGFKRPATISFGIGGALIGASFIPEWAWIILLLGGAAVTALYFWVEYRHKLTDKALTAVVGATDKAGNGTETAVRENLPQAVKASGAIRAVIDEAKLKARAGK